MSNINVNNITPVTGTKVSVSGSLHASGDITANGNITLGDATTDSVTFSAEISSSIIPDANNVYDLGTTSKQWKNIYASTGSFGNLSGSITFSNNVTFQNITATSGTISYISSSSPTVFAGDIEPDADDSNNIGSSTKQWKDLYIDGTAHIDTLSGVASASIDVLSVNSNISSSLIPAQNLPHLTGPEHDLGASDKQWKNIYASTGSFGNLSGSITFSNNVTFQTLTATTITATSGTFSYLSGSSPITTAAPLHPDVTNTHDIGTSALQFKDLYADGVGHIDKIQAGDATIAQVGTGTANININSLATASLYTSASISSIRFENLPTSYAVAQAHGSGTLFRSQSMSGGGMALFIS